MANPNGFWAGFGTDVGQRVVPGGATGRQGARTPLQMLLHGVGSLVLPGGGAVGAELGERLDNTGVGRFINHPIDSISGFLSGLRGGGQTPVAGTTPRSNANAYLTGNFQQRPANNNPLVNLNYGQNGQEVQMQGGGLPGITGPNIYAGRQSGTPSMGSFMGRTPGTASMSQISEMLMSGGRGRGERPLFSPHEINEERARAKALGLTLAEARRQGQ